MEKRFRFENKSVIILAHLVKDVTYKFIYIVEGVKYNEYEREVNGLNKEMEQAVEHCKTMILMGL